MSNQAIFSNVPIMNDLTLNDVKGGNKVCNFRIGDDFDKGTGKYQLIQRCEVWNSLADAFVKNCQKGRRIVIWGKLKHDNYENDKGKHFGTVLIADHIDFLGTTKDTKSEDEAGAAAEIGTGD